MFTPANVSLSMNSEISPERLLVFTWCSRISAVLVFVNFLSYLRGYIRDREPQSQDNVIKSEIITHELLKLKDFQKLITKI